jgi:HlyD family secretion protein
LLPAADFPSVDIVLAINGQKELEESTMVTNSKKSLFRKKPLEKAAAPEQLDQPIQIIKLLTWLPLATLGSLVIAAITWSITGRIPITATGQGVLIYPSTIVDVQAFGTGQLLELKIKVGDTVKKGDILATLDQTELKKQLQQMQAKRSLLRVQHEQANALQQQRSKGQQASLAQQILSFQQQLRAAQGMVPVHKNRLKNHQWLKSEGAISGEAVLVVQQAYSESLDKVSTLKAQLQEVNSQQSLFPEENFAARIARQNEIQEVERDIAQLKLQSQKQGQIVSSYSGQILEITATAGQAVSPGTRIGTIAEQNSNSKLMGITFFPDSEGKKLQPGMNVEVTPTTVKRERFGGIIGNIKEVSAYPVTKEGVNRLVGNPEVTQALMAKGPQIQMLAELQPDPSTFSKFKWSSSKGPDLKVSAGTLTTVRVTLEERAPITFVLPILRSWTGLN